MTGAEDVRELLLTQGETLSPAAREAILARGKEAVPPLAAVLADESLEHEDAPGEGWAPFHASELLTALGGEEAIRALVEALSRCNVGEGMFDILLEDLEELGPAVGPIALEQLLRTEALDGRIGLLEVLAKTGLKDERVYQHLLRLLEEEPGSAAWKLAHYGDARAIEPLKQAFDRVSARATEGFAEGMDTAELAVAIQRLGGTLDAEQQARLEAARTPESVLAEALAPLAAGTSEPAQRKPRPGRNEPCWCGSGVKYKKCHAASDER